MIDGISVTSPEFRRIKEHVTGRLEELQERLCTADDPMVIHRLQGAIGELKNLIAPPDGV